MKSSAQMLDRWLGDEIARGVLGVNEYEGTRWIRKESCEELLAWPLTVAEVERTADPALDEGARARDERACGELAARILTAAEAAGYRLEALVAQMRG